MVARPVAVGSYRLTAIFLCDTFADRVAHHLGTEGYGHRACPPKFTVRVPGTIRAPVIVAADADASDGHSVRRRRFFHADPDLVAPPRWGTRCCRTACF